MWGRIPPFKSIEAFVVAAQSLSFTNAAALLHITVPAVSRRIQALEIELGATLFQRTHRVLTLTPVGVEYFRQLSPAIEHIRQASEHVRSRPVRNVVRIGVRPAFATSWLFPRVGAFLAQHKGVQIEYETSKQTIDLDNGDVDLAIRFGNGSWPGMHVERLLDVRAFPVCSPTLAGGKLWSAEARDVLKHPLLESAHELDLWPGWLHAAGIGPPASAQHIKFDSLQLSYEAALNGLGITMGLDVCSDPYLRQGRLLQPFDPTYKPAKRFYLVCRLRDRDRLVIRSLTDWLMEQAAEWQNAHSLARVSIQPS
jgi:LysR family transcriptional regulator, glycine cleavage system transcriptional activator